MRELTTKPETARPSTEYGGKLVRRNHDKGKRTCIDVISGACLKQRVVEPDDFEAHTPRKASKREA